jgi:hypothetical protein
MTQRLKLLYPFLFGILPILGLVIRNPGQASLADVAALSALVLAGCGLVYAVAALALGSRWSSPVIPLLVLMVVAWFYKYDALMRLAGKVPVPASEIVLLVIGVVGTVGVVWWLARRPRVLERVHTFLALFSMILVVWFGGRVIADQTRAGLAVRKSLLAKELARPIPVKPSATPSLSRPRPDIYLIVPDEYANSSVLRELFNFDNRVFEDSLRKLGFTIPKVVHSNYIHTSLSLPSLLNFAHLTRLSTEIGPESNDPTLPNYLVENNRVVAFLKGRGYKFLFFPSHWWLSTRHNRNADWEFRAWGGFDPGRDATRSDLRRSFVGITALKLLKDDHQHDADHIKRTFAGLAQVPAMAEPTFALAHIISPHKPYALGADCRRPKPRKGLCCAWVASKREAYIDQVQCLNSLMLSLVTTLLQRSSLPPIILLQGDHGTPSLGYDEAASASAVSPAQARERFSPFGAYYVANGGSKLFADSVTLVNVLQKVLDYYFGADVPPAPDQLYFSMDRTPYSFAEFDPVSFRARPAHAGPSSGDEQDPDVK